MVDESAPADGPSNCPWCSAALPPGAGPNCPSCGATLFADAEPQLPGVTAIDAEAIVRGRTGTSPRQRSRILSWISGEYDAGEPEVAATPGSLSPPPPDVRREMLRLELEAEVANLQAEVDAMAADELEAGAEPSPGEAPATEPAEPGQPAEPAAVEGDRST